MKKIIYSLFIFGIGCSEINNNNADINKLPMVTRDGCEYLQMRISEGYLYTHRGRCANPLHYFKDNNTYKYIISLPEGYPLISSFPDNPDTLTGYISRDTLYIGFINK